MKKKKSTQKKKFLKKSYRLYGKILLFTLSGAIMIGHGTRMIYQGIFAPGSVYEPNTFDLFFDWLTLALLGCFILWFALSLWYNAIGKKVFSQKQSISKDEKIYIYPT